MMNIIDYEIANYQKKLSAGHVESRQRVLLWRSLQSRKTTLQQNENRQKLQYRPENLQTPQPNISNGLTIIKRHQEITCRPHRDQAARFIIGHAASSKNNTATK